MSQGATIRPLQPRAREDVRWLARKSTSVLLANAATLVMLTIGVLPFILPFVWMFETAVKPKDQILVYPPVWIPRELHWENFYQAWFGSVPFTRFLVNTAIITGANIVGQTLSAAVVAFGFARMTFYGRNFLFVVLLGTMMVPPQVTLIPLFVIFKEIGWIDTFLPLIVPGFLGGGAFFIFLLRQFFLTIPDELEDAARIDGASSVQIFTRIFLPLSKSALTAVVIFSFIHHWNDFFGPLIYLTSKESKTLSLGLAMFKDLYTINWNLSMAAAFLVLLPCVIVFFVAQRYFVEGIVMTGLKG